MIFDEIIKELKTMKFNMVRGQSQDYFEAVFIKTDLDCLHEILKKYFDSNVVSSVSVLPQDVAKVVDEYGGIISGQSLYYLKKENSILLAMLWPWADGIHITIKVIKR